MADFGDPSTWEMNVDQFIDSGLPKEKPQELLDSQEQNRKQRLLQSLQKIGGRLEDSSLDFINRENFGKGSRPFLLKKEGNKVVDIVAKTPEAQEQLKNFIKEFRLSKEYAKTSTAAKQAGVKGTRALYDKYFKDHYTYKTFNQNILGAVKKKYNIKDNPIISSNPEKLQRFNPEANQKQSEKALQRYYNDTKKIKQKARKVAGMSGDNRFALHHALGLDEFETLNNLIIDKNFKGSKGTTANSLVEKALRDFEKQMKELKGKVDPASQRKSQELMAKLNRLKNGKEISYPTKKEPNKKVSFTKDQIGKYGFKANTSTGFKGLDKSQTIGFKAGVSDKLGNKPLSELNKLEQEKAVTNIAEQLKKQIASKIKSDGPTLGMNAIAPAKAAELVDFTQLPKDFKNVSDEMIKPLVEKGKIFGKKSAGQILSMARPAAKLTGLELLLGSAFTPLDIGEGRPMKDVALNAATLGIGIPVKDAKRAAAFADKYGLKEDLFTAKMKLAGANKIRGDQKIEFTDKEQQALRAETYFKEKILQPELDQLLEERQSESDPNFGLTDMIDEERVNYSNGSEGTDLAIKESLEAFQRYINAGGKLGYKDFIALGNEGVSKFFNKGGRVSFGSGTGPMPVRIIYLIMDRLRNLKNSTFENYNQVRMSGEQKGITELLEPYKNIPNKNRVTSAIDDAEELKKFMPDEYKPILNEIIDDTKQFKFKTAHDKQQALEKVLPEELKFENLPEEMFPMPNPENSSFIMPYGYPDKNPFQKSRITTRTEADKFTGKGTRKTYDTFNEETKQYQEPSKNTLISEEPIGEELESIIRDLDKGDLQ